jgi:hypothetical protein
MQPFQANHILKLILENSQNSQQQLFNSLQVDFFKKRERKNNKNRMMAKA